MKPSFIAKQNDWGSSSPSRIPRMNHLTKFNRSVLQGLWTGVVLYVWSYCAFLMGLLDGKLSRVCKLSAFTQHFLQELFSIYVLRNGQPTTVLLTYLPISSAERSGEWACAYLQATGGTWLVTVDMQNTDPSCHYIQPVDVTNVLTKQLNSNCVSLRAQ